MRLATWNVNSLKARQEAVERWLERAAPDILLLQETKLTDGDAPVMAFAMAGYQLVHHGEGRWNGVAIAARNGLTIDDVVTNFGDGPVRDSGAISMSRPPTPTCGTPRRFTAALMSPSPSGPPSGRCSNPVWSTATGSAT